MMPITCIIGTDGSGKTTHANLIIQSLQKSGLRTRYVWFRFFHFFSLIPLAYGRIAGLTVYEKKKQYIYGRHEFYRSRLIATIYPWTLFFDMSIVHFFKLFLPQIHGYILVCDRCAYDTLVDLMIDLDNPEFPETSLGKLFSRMINPKTTSVIFLDVPEPIIFERRPELRYDPTIEMRRKSYQKLSQMFGIKTILNDGDLHEINRKILNQLNSE